VAPLSWYLGGILGEEIPAGDVAVAVLAEDHIGTGDGEHVALDFIAVKLLFLDGLPRTCIGHAGDHLVHGGHKKSAGAAAGVEDHIVGPYVQEFAEEFADVRRGEDNAQRLSVSAGVVHEFSVEAPDEVFRGGAVLEAFEDAVAKEFGVIFERGLAEGSVYGIQFFRGPDDGEFAHEFVPLGVGPDVGCLEPALYGIIDLLAVGVHPVANEIVHAEKLIVQGQEDAGHDKGLVLVFQGTICAKVLVKLRRVLEDFFGGLFHVCLFVQDGPGVVFANVPAVQRGKGLNVGEGHIGFSVVHVDRCDPVMFFVAGDADGEDFFKVAVLGNVFGVEIRAVHGVIDDGRGIGIKDAAVLEFYVPVKIGLVFHNENEVVDDGHVFGVSGVSCPALGRGGKGLVDFLHGAALGCVFNPGFF